MTGKGGSREERYEVTSFSLCSYAPVYTFGIMVIPVISMSPN